MSELLARAASVFLAPAPAARETPAVPAAPPSLVGLYVAATDAAAVVGGVAADLRRRHRTRVAVVCAAGPAPTPGLASRAARGLAGRLADHDLEAVAVGAICRLTLPDDPESAPRMVWRAVAVAAGAPVVIVPPLRDAAFDALLSEADALLVAVPHGASGVYGELTLASLAALGPPAALVQVPIGFLARRRAALGLSRLGALEIASA